MVSINMNSTHNAYRTINSKVDEASIDDNIDTNLDNMDPKLLDDLQKLLSDKNLNIQNLLLFLKNLDPETMQLLLDSLTPEQLQMILSNLDPEQFNQLIGDLDPLAREEIMAEFALDDLNTYVNPEVYATGISRLKHEMLKAMMGKLPPDALHDQFGKLNFNQLFNMVAGSSELCSAFLLEHTPNQDALNQLYGEVVDTIDDPDAREALTRLLASENIQEDSQVFFESYVAPLLTDEDGNDDHYSGGGLGAGAPGAEDPNTPPDDNQWSKVLLKSTGQGGIAALRSKNPVKYAIAVMMALSMAESNSIGLLSTTMDTAKTNVDILNEFWKMNQDLAKNTRNVDWAKLLSSDTKVPNEKGVLIPFKDYLAQKLGYTDQATIDANLTPPLKMDVFLQIYNVIPTDDVLGSKVPTEVKDLIAQYKPLADTFKKYAPDYVTKDGKFSFDSSHSPQGLLNIIQNFMTDATNQLETGKTVTLFPDNLLPGSDKGDKAKSSSWGDMAKDCQEVHGQANTFTQKITQLINAASGNYSSEITFTGKLIETMSTALNTAARG